MIAPTDREMHGKPGNTGNRNNYRGQVMCYEAAGVKRGAAAGF